ncbi:hypothetical protein ACR80S_12345 [Halomonas sp. MA07-2]|uniref:hypothetical protein n=1 Tax=Halomonas sp. MA07-2 TaxID=3440841 RepID=UPI003EF0160C
MGTILQGANPPLTRRAAEAFNRGDYEDAYNLYLQAARLYGEALFRANIVLCEKRIGVTQEVETLTHGEGGKVSALQAEIRQLKRQLKEKDASIKQRFDELALLTKMLEEKNAFSGE